MKNLIEGSDYSRLNSLESQKNFELEAENISQETLKVGIFVENIEKKMGEIDGLDGGEILKIYGELTKEKVAKEVEDDEVQKIISGLVKGEDIVDEVKRGNFSSDKLNLIFACFMFLVLSVDSQNISPKKEKELSLEEVEKINIDKFLKKLEIVEITQDQKFFDIKIPPKPINRDYQNWLVCLFDFSGNIVGRFGAEEKTIYKIFGKNGESEVAMAKLVIEEGGNLVKEINIDIKSENE